MTLALVTGATGWLGARLRLALLGRLPDAIDRDPVPRVRSLARTRADESRLEQERVSEGEETLRGDLRSDADVRRFCDGADGAVLFHCAGVIHPRWRVREFTEVNVEGTRRLLEAAEAAGVRRVVVMSSNSPFGANPTREHRFDETSPYRPYMGYGRSKRRMEEIVGEAQARGRVETVVVRAPWFYGPGQPPRQSEFFRMIRRGLAPLVAGGTNLRSLGYVDDLAAGMIRCADTPQAAGRTYWMADAEPYSTAEIVETVARVLEGDFSLPCRPQRVRLPGLVSDVARVADGALQALGVYEQRVHVLSEMNLHITCSVDRARRELGHTPTVGLEEGMRRSIAWCLERGTEL